MQNRLATFEENEGIDLNVSNGSSKNGYIDEDDILNGEECAEIDTENYENEGNMENLRVYICWK